MTPSRGRRTRQGCYLRSRSSRRCRRVSRSALTLFSDAVTVAGVRLDLAADVLYERRNVEPVLARFHELAPEGLVALAGRPYEDLFLREAAGAEKIAPRIVRIAQ